MVLNKREPHPALVAAAAAATAPGSTDEVEGKGAAATLPPLDGPEWLLAHPRVRDVRSRNGLMYDGGGRTVALRTERVFEKWVCWWRAVLYLRCVLCKCGVRGGGGGVWCLVSRFSLGVNIELHGAYFVLSSGNQCAREAAGPGADRGFCRWFPRLLWPCAPEMVAEFQSYYPRWRRHSSTSMPW
jgi:hypothetical protein